MTATIRHCVATAGLVLATGSYAAGHLAVSREITVDRAPDTV